MAYLDQSTILVDAILTRKGREVLSSGTGNFAVTKFALGDDEIDYSLWAPNHSLGANYYGEAIENLPILEASPDESIALRSKLVTKPIGTIYIQKITVNPSTFSLTYQSSVDLTPSTTNPALSETYTAVLSNTAAFTITSISGDSSIGSGGQPVGFTGTVSGYSFRVTSKYTTPTNNATCTILISGNTSGVSTAVTGIALPYIEAGGLGR